MGPIPVSSRQVQGAIPAIERHAVVVEDLERAAHISDPLQESLQLLHRHLLNRVARGGDPGDHVGGAAAVVVEPPADAVLVVLPGPDVEPEGPRWSGCRWTLCRLRGPGARLDSADRVRRSQSLSSRRARPEHPPDSRGGPLKGTAASHATSDAVESCQDEHGRH